MRHRDDWRESRDRAYEDDQSDADQYGRDQYSADRYGQGRSDPNLYGRGRYGSGQSSSGWGPASRYEDWHHDEGGRESERYGGGPGGPYGPTRYRRGSYGPEPLSGGPYGAGYGGRGAGYGGRGSYEERYTRGSSSTERFGYGSSRPGSRSGYSSFSDVPLAMQPSGHAPFSHSSFGESNEPHYFGTGSQGHGGGPAFTGGTYGFADPRSDAPYFQEVGFNRGYYEEPFGAETHEPSAYPYARASSEARPVPRRRYPMGPKGYQRSDERMCEDISERLMEAYHIDSSEVTVQVLGGKVVLEGTVPDRRMKHAIEDMACAAPGVQDVDNRIRVLEAERQLSDVGRQQPGDVERHFQGQAGTRATTATTMGGAQSHAQSQASGTPSQSSGGQGGTTQSEGSTGRQSETGNGHGMRQS